MHWELQETQATSHTKDLGEVDWFVVHESNYEDLVEWVGDYIEVETGVSDCSHLKSR